MRLLALSALSPRRLAGAAVIACAAALMPVAALAATAAPAAPAASTPGCATAGLVIWFSPQVGGGYAGGYYYNLNFTNLSGRACTLRGYPGVSAVNLRGRQLGNPHGCTSRPCNGARRRSAATGCGAGTGRAPLAVSELDQLGVRYREPFPPRTEINKHGDTVLDTDDQAQAVTVVRHPVLHGEPLDRWRGWDIEGACGQVAPGHGAGSLHYHQYALAEPIAGLLGGTRLVATRGDTAPTCVGVRGCRLVPAGPTRPGARWLPAVCDHACSGSRPSTERPPSTGTIAPLMKLASADSR